MGLLYYPSAGELVMCNYDAVVIDPEMRKARPVVVVGPRLRRRGRLATVLPLSTTEPDPVENYHCRIELAQPLPPPFDSLVMWAKCDMIATVSLDRLDRFKDRRPRGSARQWRTGKVSVDQLYALRVSLLCGLGFDSLTKHL
ncbi:type II toxin-antitoxin system PemK/MazF family toxin [Sphingomonas sp.]|uniref:type II toxin-antitoxin system PemK/MazF family toxin n=1 Tax=Sphingomonas sp. TaxID=28214 RepID=UPI002E2EDE48|nr:type II toxin-antitoxin system PemK/MazF family toxin [Sphingomonas sp.]HEX4693272.1 type II toxin-antitoxin system PemK/MazF family toxin [Sphingomonas sp.]